METYFANNRGHALTSSQAGPCMYGFNFEKENLLRKKVHLIRYGGKYAPPRLSLGGMQTADNYSTPGRLLWGNTGPTVRHHKDTVCQAPFTGLGNF